MNQDKPAFEAGRPVATDQFKLPADALENQARQALADGNFSQWLKDATTARALELIDQAPNGIRALLESIFSRCSDRRGQIRAYAHMFLAGLTGATYQEVATMTGTSKQNIHATVARIQKQFGYRKAPTQRSPQARQRMAAAYRATPTQAHAKRVRKMRESHAKKQRKGTWIRSGRHVNPPRRPGQLPKPDLKHRNPNFAAQLNFKL